MRIPLFTRTELALIAGLSAGGFVGGALFAIVRWVLR